MHNTNSRIVATIRAGEESLFALMFPAKTGKLSRGQRKKLNKHASGLADAATAAIEYTEANSLQFFGGEMSQVLAGVEEEMEENDDDDKADDDEMEETAGASAGAGPAQHTFGYRNAIGWSYHCAIIS